MSIYLDVSGGDNPLEVLKGALLAKKEGLLSDIALIGNKETIIKSLEGLQAKADDYEIIDAPEEISMGEDPAKAVRSKKNSAIVVGCSLIKGKDDAAFLSAGSTGAVLAGALMYTGRIKGILRPAMGVALPGKKPVLLIDNGANADCKAEYFPQFAYMGTAYAKSVFGVASPRIGLLNIGAEEGKGSMLVKEAYELLKPNPLFVGNVEPKELLDGVVDIAVCDGFTGNAVLKAMEGALNYAAGIVKATLKSGAAGMAAGLLVQGKLKKAFSAVSDQAVGAAPFLGVDGCVMKAHGASDSMAIKSALFLADAFAKNKAISTIKELLAE
ncbi:MAG: phosphate acyltransferase PlsX [Eubacteriaceae bacterium]|nr:phosphate acyltransferase PlsX [Eubacteriaceae bacterium]